MPTTLRRSVLTARLLAELRGHFVDARPAGMLACPVGDMERPDNTGWTNRDGDMVPGDTFVPWLILTPLTAQAMGQNEPIGDTGGDWRLPYSLSTWGESRVMAEDMADEARDDVLNPLKGADLDLGDAHYSVQQIRVTTIGGVNRTAAERQRPTYSQQDGFEVWVSRQRRG